MICFLLVPKLLPYKYQHSPATGVCFWGNQFLLENVFFFFLSSSSSSISEVSEQRAGSLPAPDHFLGQERTSSSHPSSPSWGNTTSAGLPPCVSQQRGTPWDSPSLSPSSSPGLQQTSSNIPDSSRSIPLAQASIRVGGCWHRGVPELTTLPRTWLFNH